MNRFLSALLVSILLGITSFVNAQIVDLGAVTVRGELIARKGNFAGNPLVLKYTINEHGVEVPDIFRICHVSDSVTGDFWEDSFHLAINTSTNQVVVDGSETITPDFFVYNGSNPALPVFKFSETTITPETIPENEAISGERVEKSSTVYVNGRPGNQFRGTDIITVSENYINSSGEMVSTFCQETWSITGYLNSTPPTPEPELTLIKKIRRLTYEAFAKSDIKTSKSTGALKVKSKRTIVLGKRG